MPFMKGKAPIRRTLQYLNAGQLMLKDKVKIFSVNYNTYGEHHEGARDFVFWNIPQIQYKNPKVQVVTFKNMTPSPFIRCYFENGNQMLIDIDSKNRQEILQHLTTVVGKSAETLKAEAKLAEKQDNPANFGVGCQKHCICEIPGQLPCPGVVPVPQHMRGKYKYQMKE
ncbi:probable 28S ribosomal protein S25, mitochondrial [Anopheles aquasalis]|uniref:Small ribosomal subunit protein mS25 n=4 Tax=Nyssorhynchus TaxID=44543 RepID=W5JQX8_ANODA|nr:probable 28S ribosomal protein S25, mitochondrial [Anopheles albimanus]XP_035793853.1 probable 28S ribosomal protein S25, mitochondrial [Anopheles albimanus]XP_049544686.1 probable 28S ribosomal protein S25, mitochondrial [Anopheles darlingi]XP_050094992.1 probable 28S ribosomal protein S25, mitochondrial [Anopheles aquasalis]ETN65708.1 mitochondrial ribosomal protein S25 [Anopheles darlingi]